MSYDMRTDPVVIARDRELAGELPNITDPCPNVYMKWEDVVKRYPHCWVLLSDVEYTENMLMIGGVVRNISLYDSDECIEYRFSHDNCMYIYTSDCDGRIRTLRGYE